MAKRQCIRNVKIGNSKNGMQMLSELNKKTKVTINTSIGKTEAINIFLSHDCLWKHFYASKLPQAPFRLESFDCFFNFKPLTQL